MHTKTQAKSATTPPHYSLLESVDKMDQLHARIGFLMDSLTAQSDWIDDEAACGLYFTLKTIWHDIDDVSVSVYAELRR